MNSSILFLFTFLFFIAWVHAGNTADNVSFNDNFYVTWGSDHALLLNQEREIQLSLDNNSGSGFESKWRYGSGFFHMRIKLPDKNSTGVLTTFYLTSYSSHHDEIDLEFLGNNGPPYLLHTNLFSNGQGGREQRILLWFDPTQDFHSYNILWNQHQVVYYVDDIPVRMFKNNAKLGVSYPIQPMQVEGSIWNAEGWASNGKKIDWSQAPFKAYFQDFSVDGCLLQDSNIEQCYSSNFWWNKEQYWNLSPEEQKSFEIVRKKYLVYDYCSDKSRYPQQPPECQSNQ